MKRLLFLIIIITSLSTYAQNDEKILKATSLEALFIDSLSNKVLTSVPWGYNVVISYKPFFKNYQVVYLDKNNAIGYINFDYLQDLQGGDLAYTERISGKKYTLSKLVTEKNEVVLTFKRDKTEKGVYVIFIVRNVIEN